jgi:hypothetical protein
MKTCLTLYPHELAVCPGPLTALRPVQLKSFGESVFQKLEKPYRNGHVLDGREWRQTPEQKG